MFLLMIKLKAFDMRDGCYTIRTAWYCPHCNRFTKCQTSL